ncbi:hypothetical protein [Mesorhizobium sp. M0674]|uniref:hypothetical protein n=1 Tax=unclassified Mesorhizobium TaxID=325217 RepID=UPI003337B28F
MALSHDQKSALLAATKQAAIALLEDIEHIKRVVSTKKTSRTEVRYLSTTLRRLLVDRELAEIAAPRMGRILLSVPDNKPFYAIEKDAPFRFFASGGAPLFGARMRPLMARETSPAMREREMMLLNLTDATTQVRLDGFLAQKVICLNGAWASRQEVIKFVANLSSGAHTGLPKQPVEVVLAKTRNAVSVTSDGGNITLTAAGSVPIFENLSSDFAYAPESMDVVLHEVLSAGYYLTESPDVNELIKQIQVEFLESDSLHMAP